MTPLITGSAWSVINCERRASACSSLASPNKGSSSTSILAGDSFIDHLVQQKSSAHQESAVVGSSTFTVTRVEIKVATFLDTLTPKTVDRSILRPGSLADA